MNRWNLSRRCAVAVVFSVAAGGILTGQEHAQTAAPVSVETYRARLLELRGLAAECARAHDASHCDPKLIGADSRVMWSDGRAVRTVRYDWLRMVFARAKQGDNNSAAQQLGPVAKGQSSAELLQAAEERLDRDIAQTTAPGAALPNYQDERAKLKLVLAGNEFKNLKREDAKSAWLEKLARWLNHLFSGFGRFRSTSAWVGRALVWGFVLTIVVGLVWALIQMERRWRVRLVPDADGPAPDAASARDWQLWMADARDAAAKRAWREAIHFLYWASISRLESKRLWPADRARTPREYLALVRREDGRHANLRALTELFERTWYGGRDARESDFRTAENVATELIGGGHASPAITTTAAQGGAL